MSLSEETLEIISEITLDEVNIEEFKTFYKYALVYRIYL